MYSNVFEPYIFSNVEVKGKTAILHMLRAIVLMRIDTCSKDPPSKGLPSDIVNAIETELEKWGDRRKWLAEGGKMWLFAICGMYDAKWSHIGLTVERYLKNKGIYSLRHRLRIYSDNLMENRWDGWAFYCFSGPSAPLRIHFENIPLWLWFQVDKK